MKFQSCDENTYPTRSVLDANEDIVDAQVLHPSVSSVATFTRKRQLELDRLFHSAPAAYVRLDEKGVIDETNLAGAHLLRSPNALLTDQPFSKHIHESQRDQFLPFLERALDSGLMQELQVSVCDAEGNCIPVLLMCSAVRRHQSERHGYQMIMINFERQNNAEKRLQQAKNYLEHLAHHDSLTGLPNRMMFFDRLRSSITRCEHNGGKLAVLFFDIDGFKPINDALGHSAGDLLLREIADRLKNLTSSENTVARLGGDEFIMVIEFDGNRSSVLESARLIAEAIRQPIRIGDDEVNITSSIGMSIFPDHGTSAEELVRGADLAMYRSKAAGRNQLNVLSRTQLKVLDRDARLAIDLVEGIKNDQFELHYQPIFDLHNSMPWHVEALCRWQHPKFGAILPNEFIPIAEKSGCIKYLGEWVLRSAVAQAREWLDVGLNLPIAVNVSARQLQDHTFVQKIEKLLHEFQLPARYLELELTETELMTNQESEVVLSHCRDMGLNLSIDDFGTGYSSLARLINLPLSRLKIDRSLIAEIGKSSDADTIVKTIITMVHGLDLKVVSEGVETLDQLLFLKKHGSDGVQGFLFSEPVAADQLPAKIRQIQLSKMKPNIRSGQRNTENAEPSERDIAVA